MAITLQGTPTLGEAGSGALSASVAYPTGIVAGELLVLAVTASSSGVNGNPPSGWTLARENDNTTANTMSGAIFYKVATGSESGSVTVNPYIGTNREVDGGRITLQMFRFSGVNTTTPMDVTGVIGGSSVATSYTHPSITTVTNGAVVFYTICLNESGSSTITTSSGPTYIGTGPTDGVGREQRNFIETKSTAGSVGSRLFNNSGNNSTQWGGVSIAMRPTTDGGGGDPPPPPPPGGDGGITGEGSPTGTAPTLTSRAVGIHDTNPSTMARVQTKTSGAVAVRLRVGLDANYTTGVKYSQWVTPDSNGNARLVVTDLAPGTRYYYKVLMRNSTGGEWVDTAPDIGRIKTAPNGPSTFSFCFSSCNSGYGTSTFTAIKNRGDDMFLHLGDLYYADGSGTGLSNFRTRMGQALTSAQNFWSNINSMYIPSDHDGMNNNGSYGDDPTAWNNWNIVRSELMPNPNSYMTWTWGPRVRFIAIDTRSFKSRTNETDNSSHTALGATQKAWFKSVIQASEEQLIIIAQDSAWVTAGEAGEDSWEGFQTERNELADFMAAQTDKRFVILGGDMHAVTYHVGGSGSPGGATVFMAAPIKNTASHKGGPWSITPQPSAGTSNTEQYGRCTITDTGGTNIAVNYTAYTASGSQRFTYTKNFTVDPYLGPSGTQVGVYRAEISAVPDTPSEARVYRADISVPVGTSAARVYRAEIAVVGSADPGPNLRNLSPGLTVEMAATAPGTPIDWVWDQIAGPTVNTSLSADKTKCTYITPAVKADTILAFRVVATYADGAKSGEGITRHEIVRTAHLHADADGTTGTVTFRPIEVGVPTEGGEEEPDPGGGGDPPPPPPPPPTPGYQPTGGPTGITWDLKLADDFNELNRQLWTPYLINEGGVNNTSGTYSRNVTIENGEVALKQESSSAGAAISSNPRDGVAGHTGFEFTTGYLEARIYFPGGATIPNWPVFLTQGQAPLPTNGENDIAEVAGWSGGGDHSMSATYHYEEAGHKTTGVWQIAPGPWGGTYHTYALHRRTDGVNDYYYDGIKVFSHLRRETAPHYIAIITEATTNPNQLYGDASKVKVDYVRFWTEKASSLYETNFGTPQHEDRTIYTYPNLLDFGPTTAPPSASPAPIGPVDFVAHWYNDFGLDHVALAANEANGWYGWYDWRWNFPTNTGNRTTTMGYDQSRHPLQGFYKGDNADVLGWQCYWLAHAAQIRAVALTQSAGFTSAGWSSPSSGSYWIYQLFHNVPNFAALKWALSIKCSGTQSEIQAQNDDLVNIYKTKPGAYTYTDTDGKRYAVVTAWEFENIRGVFDNYVGQTNTATYLKAFANKFKPNFDGVLILARNGGVIASTPDPTLKPAGAWVVWSDYENTYKTNAEYSNLYSNYAATVQFPSDRVVNVVTAAETQFPHPSGWALRGSTPQLFRQVVEKAVTHAVSSPMPKIVTVYNVAEWAEGGPGLIPNKKDGFGYLDALRGIEVTEAPQANARYVSYGSGNDSNAGTMDAPWKTLGKVRTELMAGTIGRGNKVLLKRGDTFYGPEFNCPVVSGTSGYVDFDAYGIGPLPRVSGAKVSLNSWVQHSTNIWKLNIAAGSGQYTGNTTATETNVGFLRVNGQIKGWKKWSLSAVGSDWDFYNDGTYVYVKLGQSPGAGVEIIPRQNAWRPSSNTRVKNIHLDAHGAHGFALYSVNNCQITHCVVENIGGSALSEGTRYGNACEIWIGCSNILVENNTFRQTYDVAVTMQGTIEGSNKAWTNVVIQLNRIENCNQSLELWARGTAASGTGYIGCRFVDNMCVDAGYSWAALIRPDSVGRGTHILTYDMQLPIDFEIARNVFLRARHNYAYCTWNNVFPSGINSHDNQITLAAGQKILYQASETIEQWQAYVTRTGEEIGTDFYVQGTEPTSGDGLTAAVAQNWGSPVRGDEFNYVGAPDPAKWSVYNSAGHAGNGTRTPTAWHCNGSVMRVTGDTLGNTGGMSALFDRNLPLYHRIETRMRTSVRHPEYHPVLLMWPDNAGSVISGVPEVDYAEGTGDVTKIKFFLHYGTSSQTQAERVIDTTEWHNYAVEWGPNAVVGYIDGVEWFRDTDPTHIPSIPMHSTIQLDWFPNDSADPAPPVCWMEVNWTRGYNI